MSEDTEWVIETVIQFLHCPIWKTPVLTYIETNCLVFDPEDENSLSYTEIHKKYQDLVEMLLTGFVEDIGIEAEAFVDACKLHTDKHPQSTLTLFEQVEAAQDFNVFKRMMIQKNIDLELQALKMIQERNGVVPGILQPDGKTDIKYSHAMVDTEEERTLQEVIRRSKEEYEAQKARETTEINKDLDKAIANSKDEMKRLDLEKKREADLMEKTLKMKISGETEKTLKPIEKKSSAGIKNDLVPSTSSAKSPPPAVKSPPPTVKSPSGASPSSVTGAEAAANWLSSAKAEASSDSPSASRASVLSNSNAAEIKKREEYLKQQRDRLLAMKKKEREKNLANFTQKEAKSRPKSARVAKNATLGNVDSAADSSKEEQEKMLAMRRALATRLKQEVINKN